MAMGIKDPRGPGETAGVVSQTANHENKIIITRRMKKYKGGAAEWLRRSKPGLECQ